MKEINLTDKADISNERNKNIIITCELVYVLEGKNLCYDEIQ
jgi:hypothetical protein